MPSPRYQPLTRHLSTLLGNEVEMAFSEVEKILGRRLPDSARGEFARHWWANTKTHSQGQGWLDAGWKVERVDPGRERVRLTRQGGGPGVAEAAPPFKFDGGEQGLLPAAQRMIDDYAEEKGVDRAQAVVAILNDAALERRRKTIEWFAARGRPQNSDSVDLIREDRDR